MSKHPLYPCLWFNQETQEAVDFYRSVFSDSKIIAQNPLVSHFELHGMRFMALNGGPMFTMNPSISVFVNCQNSDEAHRIWNALIENGSELIPLGKYPWSNLYGWLKDKYGFTWQISQVAELPVTIQLTPCLLFTRDVFGRGEEAVRFYTDLFPESSITRLEHYSDQDPNSGKLLYSEFLLNQYKLIAMDGPGDHAYRFDEGISLVITCEDQAEIDYYWNKLTEGGEESMCGWLKDKFGISWQVVPEILGKLMSDPERSQRVINAFLKMRKFDIQALLDA